jgi:hypothetical protein
MTPWGEALIHPWYQQALAKLTSLPNVEKAAIQTNLSCKLEWVEDCNKERLALWTTFHPEWVSIEQFVAQCSELDRRGVRFSVGVVGFPKFKDAIAALRHELPSHVYMWINAVKRELPQLSEADREFFESIIHSFTSTPITIQVTEKAVALGRQSFQSMGMVRFVAVILSKSRSQIFMNLTLKLRCLKDLVRMRRVIVTLVTYSWTTWN